MIIVIHAVYHTLSSLIRNLALEILQALEGCFGFESVDALIARAEMVLRASVLLIAGNPTSEMETCVLLWKELFTD